MRATRSFRRGLTMGVAAAVAWAVTAIPANAAPGDLTLASTSGDGTKGNGSSVAVTVSADGRRVAFASHATNLTPADGDSTMDVFVKDLDTGEVVLVSTPADGPKGTSTSNHPSLSADGTVVAFASGSPNLVDGDTNGTFDVFVKDLETGQVVRVSTAGDGTQANHQSATPSLSADGTRVAFYSFASNLVENDTNGGGDVFVKDLTTGALWLASAAGNGAIGDAPSAEPFLSADGTRVAFNSYASNLVEGDTNGRLDVYVKDLATGGVTLASTSPDGSVTDSDSFGPTLSADGRRVSFGSSASTLVEGDTNGQYDVFVRDLTTGETTVASATADGTIGTGESMGGHLSGDGTRIAFHSRARNLADSTNDYDVFVKDLTTGEITVVSTTAEGTLGNATSWFSALSTDGRSVAFQSDATNFDGRDTDALPDVYVRELAATVVPEPAPTCEGRTATVYVAGGQVVGGPLNGQPYAGELRGTDGPDVIVGTDQTDRVLAAGGDDLVCALGGIDNAFGGSGNDRLLGGDGSDRLSGNSGRDALLGAAGNDRLTGGAQADQFDGGPGRDVAVDYQRRQGDTITAVP